MRFALLGIALLVALDIWTKGYLVTQEWAWHAQPGYWLAYVALAIVLTAPFLALPATRLPAALLIAASLGNGFSELVYGSVPNPFVISTHGGSMVAFNLADLYLMAALVPLFVAIPRLTRRVA